MGKVPEKMRSIPAGIRTAQEEICLNLHPDPQKPAVVWVGLLSVGLGRAERQAGTAPAVTGVRAIGNTNSLADACWTERERCHQRPTQRGCGTAGRSFRRESR